MSLQSSELADLRETLERLGDYFVFADAKYKLLMETRKYLQNDPDLYAVAPGFFTLIHESLTIDLMISVARLYEENRSDRNLQKFLNAVEMNMKSVNALDSRINVSVVARHRAEIGKQQQVLVNLKTHRDKLLVHHDKEYFLEPRKAQSDAPITFEELSNLLKTAEEILRTYYPALTGAMWARGLLEALDVRRLFHVLRVAEQRTMHPKQGVR